MKNIVVAIDFSKDSLHALQFAIVFANQIKANITMIWVNKPESSDSIYENQKNKIVEEAKSRFENLIKKHSCILKHGQLDYKIQEGKVYKEIINQAKYLDAYMIIAGTHGVSGFEEFWIGSNAYKIVSSAPCPVITIRNGFDFKKTINKIIVPIDNTIETREKVPMAVNIAKLFNSEIHLISMYTSSFKDIRQVVDNYAKQACKFIEENQVNCICSNLEAENISDSIIKYGTKIDADLIAIMSEQEMSATQLILGSTAQQTVNHSPIPVLTVHSKEIYKIQPRL